VHTRRTVESAINQPTRETVWKNPTKAVNVLHWAWSTLLGLQLKDREQKKSRFKIWDSRPYFESARQNPQQAVENIRVDLKTLYDEYAATFHKKKYPQWGLYGLRDTYSKKTTEICEDFVREMENLAEKGMKSGRAKLEAWAAKALEEFLTNPAIPVGAVLILFSPRGKLNEAYPGDAPENYVFVNAFVKTAQASNEPTPQGKNQPFPACFHQFTSYALTPQLLQQHAKMKDRCNNLVGIRAKTYHPNDVFSQESVPIPPLSDSNNPEHWLIAQPIMVFPDQDGLDSDAISDAILVEINHILYENQKNPDGTDWAIKIDDLPELDTAAFEEISQKVVDQLVAAFEEIFTEDTTKNVADFDELVLLFRDYLLKWVEINDKKSQNTSNRDGKSNSDLPDIESIIQIWKIGKSGNTKSRKHQKNNKNDSLSGIQNELRLSNSLLNQIASSAHCIINPGGLLNKAVQLPTQSIAGIQPNLQFGQFATKNLGTTVFSRQNLQLNQTESSNKKIQETTLAMETLINLKNKHTKLISLKSSLLPLEIYNYQKKRMEVIYVLLSDPTYFAEYNRQCYKLTSTGPVLGPCHVDLDEDGLLLTIPHENSSKKFLSLDQYNALTQEIFELEMQLILQSALINQLNLEGNGNNSLDSSDVEKITAITKSLSSKIFRITFSDLVAGVVDYTDEFLTLPGKCISFLNSYGQNKIAGVKKLLLILEENDLATILKALQIAV